MTVIAYKDGILASDSQLSGEGETIINGSTKKLWRNSDGWLIGLAGEYHKIVAVKKWFKKGMKKAFPEDTKTVTGILVSPKGKVYWLEHGVRVRTKEPYHAEGAGAREAMAAMFMGASAELAVQVACLYNAGCSGDVQTMKLGVE